MLFACGATPQTMDTKSVCEARLMTYERPVELVRDEHGAVPCDDVLCVDHLARTHPGPAQPTTGTPSRHGTVRASEHGAASSTARHGIAQQHSTEHNSKCVRAFVLAGGHERFRAGIRSWLRPAEAPPGFFPAPLRVRWTFSSSLKCRGYLSRCQVLGKWR